jgi:hypothetical protein
MIPLLIILALATVFSHPVLADLPLVGDDEIPEKLTQVEDDGIHVFTRISLDERWFGVFSLGGSTDLPAAEAERLRSIVSGVGPNQWVFVQATADANSWKERRSKEEHRLDVTVALARTLWGLDNLQRKRVTTLPPKLNDTRRGLRVAIATYSEQVIPFPVAPPVPVVAPVVSRESESESSSLAIGLEGGFGILSSDDLDMTTPTIDLVIEKQEVRLDLGVGWWPAGDNELGDLADASAKATLTWFPNRGWIGPFVGWVVGSQFVRSVTEYVTLAHGPAFGATLRGSRWRLDGALRVGYTRLNFDELDQDQRWSNGFVLSAQVGKVF